MSFTVAALTKLISMSALAIIIYSLSFAIEYKEHFLLSRKDNQIYMSDEDERRR